MRIWLNGTVQLFVRSHFDVTPVAPHADHVLNAEARKPLFAAHADGIIDGELVGQQFQEVAGPMMRG